MNLKCDICGKEIKDVNHLYDASPFMGFVCGSCKNKYVVPFTKFLIDDNIQGIYIPYDLKHKKLETFKDISYNIIKDYLKLENEKEIMTQKFSTELIMIYPEYDIDNKPENILFRQLMHGLQLRDEWKGDYLVVKSKGWNDLNDR